MPREKPGRGADQFPLRLPDGMREQIKVAADRKGVSMNQEIVRILDEYYPAYPNYENVTKLVEMILTTDENLEDVGKRYELYEALKELLSKIEIVDDSYRYKEKKTNIVYMDDDIKDQINSYAKNENAPFSSVYHEILQLGLMVYGIPLHEVLQWSLQKKKMKSGNGSNVGPKAPVDDAGR